MRVLRAVIRAELELLWNVVRREGAAANTIASAAMLPMLLVALAPPIVGAGLLGLSLGRDFDDISLRWPMVQWAGGVHLFAVVVFGGLGGVFRPRGTGLTATLQRYPVGRGQRALVVLLAEGIGTLPLFAAALLVAFGIGLAWPMPALAAVVMVLTGEGIASVLIVQRLTGFLLAGVLDRCPRLPGGFAGVLLGGSVLAVAIGEGLPGLARQALTLCGRALPQLPTTSGYLGLHEMATGRPWLGAALVVESVLFVAFGMCVALLCEPTPVDASAAGRPERSLPPGPRAAIGRLLEWQVLGSRAGRILLLQPFVIVSVVVVCLRVLLADPGAQVLVPVDLQRTMGLPWPTIVLPLTVLMNRDLWMNQFGWDRAGVRALLCLPIANRDLLLGKLSGLARLHALQAVPALLPLLWLRRPGAAELVAGLAGGGIALLGAAAVGQLLSVRFARSVQDATCPPATPLVSVASAAVSVAVAASVCALHQAGEALGSWGPAAVLTLGATIAAAGYRALLPRLEADLNEHRERLVSELA